MHLGNAATEQTCGPLDGARLAKHVAAGHKCDWRILEDLETDRTLGFALHLVGPPPQLANLLVSTIDRAQPHIPHMRQQSGIAIVAKPRSKSPGKRSWRRGTSGRLCGGHAHAGQPWS